MYDASRIEDKRRRLISDFEYSEVEKVPFKINGDFVFMNILDECYRELMVSYIPMLPLFENDVRIEEADYIVYAHAFARCEDLSGIALEEVQWIADHRKDGAEIIVVGKAANLADMLGGSIDNITFWGDHFTEKLGKRFGVDIIDEYIVFDDELNHLAIWPVNGCLQKCKFCRRSYMNIKFESLDLENIKGNLDLWKKVSPKEMKNISLRAENLTEYGIDIYGSQKLHELIDLIDSYDEVESIELPIGISIGEITPEIIDSLCKSKKVKKVGLNLEAGSDRLLQLIGKRHTREQAIEIFRRLREAHHDIVITSTVMIGLPTEEISDIYELADLIAKTQVDEVWCNYYIMTPRQPLAKLPQMSKSLREYHLKILLKALKEAPIERNLEIGHRQILDKRLRKDRRLQAKLDELNSHSEWELYYKDKTYIRISNKK